MQRCHSFTLRMSPKATNRFLLLGGDIFSLLDKLSIQSFHMSGTIHMDLSNYPRLTSLSCRPCHSYGERLDMEISGIGITIRQLEMQLTTRQMMRLLESCPGLETCMIHLHERDILDQAQPIFQHSGIIDLTIHSYQADGSFLDHLYLPSLQKFDMAVLEPARQPPWNYLTAFLRRSRPPLVDLALICIVEDEEPHTIDSFSYMPHLQSLTLCYGAVSDAVMQALTMNSVTNGNPTNDPAPLKELRTLALANCRRSVSSIVDMVLSRCSSRDGINAPCNSLTTLSLTKVLTPREGEELLSSPGISSCVEAGLDISMEFAKDSSPRRELAP